MLFRHFKIHCNVRFFKLYASHVCSVFSLPHNMNGRYNKLGTFEILMKFQFRLRFWLHLYSNAGYCHNFCVLLMRRSFNDVERYFFLSFLFFFDKFMEINRNKCNFIVQHSLLLYPKFFEQNTAQNIAHIYTHKLMNMISVISFYQKINSFPQKGTYYIVVGRDISLACWYCCASLIYLYTHLTLKGFSLMRYGKRIFNLPPSHHLNNFSCKSTKYLVKVKQGTESSSGMTESKPQYKLPQAILLYKIIYLYLYISSYIYMYKCTLNELKKARFDIQLLRAMNNILFDTLFIYVLMVTPPPSLPPSKQSKQIVIHTTNLYDCLILRKVRKTF